jgi:hypothetical protein
LWDLASYEEEFGHVADLWQAFRLCEILGDLEWIVPGGERVPVRPWPELRSMILQTDWVAPDLGFDPSSRLSEDAAEAMRWGVDQMTDVAGVIEVEPGELFLSLRGAWRGLGSPAFS